MAFGRLADGTEFEFDTAGEVPTRAEYDAAVRKLEFDLGSKKNMPAPGTGRESSGIALMEPRSDRDVLESEIATSDRVLRSARETLAESVSDKYSMAGGFAGGLAGALGGAKLGAPLGPQAAAVSGAIGGLVGGAVGTLGGKLGGYHAPGSPSDNPVAFEDQLDRSFEAAQNDLIIGSALTGAGSVARLGKNVAGGVMSDLITGFAGYRSPEIRARILQAREFGIRLTPADIHPKFANIYGAIFGNVPIISNPLRAAQKARAAEVGPLLGALTGPLESGMNEMVLGRNFLKSATNAVRVRTDWYKRIYQKADDYMEARPHLRISNDAIDAAREHIYEQSRRARPTSSSTSTAKTITRDVSSSAASETNAQTLRARNAGYDWRIEVDPVTGQQVRRETELLPAASARDIQTGTMREAAGSTRSNVIQTTEEHYTTGGFKTPASVNQFIEDTLRSPQQLTYKQFKGLQDDIQAALEVADPTQARTLLQMKENLGAAVDNIPDDGARRLLRRSQNTYRQVMEFFENPTAAKFVTADPNFASNVKKLHKGNNGIPSLMSSELFNATFKDLPPEGVRELAKLVGPENMKAGTDRWLAEIFEEAFKTKSPIATEVDWNGLRRTFGLHSPTSSQYASTREYLQTGQHSWDIDKLGRFIDTMEREIGPEIPDLAKMYVRGAAIGGPRTALSAAFATRALAAGGKAGGVISSAKAVGLVLGLRRFSSFLADPEKLRAMGRALPSTIQPPGVTQLAARQIIRYLATDTYKATHNGQEPNAFELNLEEQKLMGVADEAGWLAPPEQSRQAAPRLGDF